MTKLSFYELTGIVIPGSVLLFGLVLLFPELRSIFASDSISVGGLGLFVLVAYAAGHLIAAIGNLVETVFWYFFGGMPSNWITFAGQNLISDQQIEQIAERISQRLDLRISSIKGMAVGEWKPFFGQIYRDVLTNNPGRIETFNGNYGLNRGLSAAVLAVAIASLISRPDRWALAIGLGAISATYLYRMYRFGVHFAREVYHCFLVLSAKPIAQADSKS